MELMQAIVERRSVRSYLPDPIPDEVILKVLEAGRLAPSARNQQMWKFIAVRDPDTQRQMAEACYSQPSMLEAPVSIVVCSLTDRVMSCGQPSGVVDACIAASFIILRAHELGLGTCWLGHFDAEKVSRILSLPEGCVPVAVTPLGKPAEAPGARPRKNIEEVTEIR